MVNLNTTFLSDEALLNACPAAGAKTHDGKRSDRYTFVDSMRVVHDLREMGFAPVRVRSVKARGDRQGHQPHEITFRSIEKDYSFVDPRQKVINHHGYHLDAAIVHPEFRWNNSSDGTRLNYFSAGLFALICANGLTVSIGDFGEVRHKHIDMDAEEIYRQVQDFVGRVPKLAETVHNFQNIQLDHDQKLEFATIARDIRFPLDKDAVQPISLLERRREEDMGNDLWTVFNVVQENAVRGGIPGRKRRTRELTNIDRTNLINQELWIAAENFAAGAF